MGQKQSLPEPEPEQWALEEYFNESGSLDALKITLMIWKHRDNRDFVHAFTEALTRFADEQTVFDEIEFYLPQLAHMIIHLEIDWPIQALERFALVVCQSSLHVALQLNWILLAAMEDYQPEDGAGISNPNRNAVFYTRCARMLQNIERCIAHGTPELNEYEEMYVRGRITAEELEDIQHTQRRETAVQILSFAETDESSRVGMSGYLMFKRNRRRCCRRKRWKRRWFEIKDRVLYCYLRHPDGQLCRAIPLLGVEVEEVDGGSQPFGFNVHSRQFHYQLSAADDGERSQWIEAIMKEMTRMPEQLPSASMSLGRSGSDDGLSIDSSAVYSLQTLRARASSFLHRIRHNEDQSDPSPHLTMNNISSMPATPVRMSSNESVGSPHRLERAGSFKDIPLPAPLPFAQKNTPRNEAFTRLSDIPALPEHSQKRYTWFCQQRGFVQELTDIAELLRFVEPAQRAELLTSRLSDLEIPPCVYLPLCKSTDHWHRVTYVLPKEARPFNTKARVPCLILFEVSRDATDRDVATFLTTQLGGRSDEAHDEQKDELPPSPASSSPTLSRKSSRRFMSFDISRRSLELGKEKPREHIPHHRGASLDQNIVRAFGEHAAEPESPSEHENTSRFRAWSESPTSNRDRRSWRGNRSPSTGNSRPKTVWRKSSTGLGRISRELKLSQLMMRLSSNSSRNITADSVTTTAQSSGSSSTVGVDAAEENAAKKAPETEPVRAVTEPVAPPTSPGSDRVSLGSRASGSNARRRHSASSLDSVPVPPVASDSAKTKPARTHVRSVTLSELDLHLPLSEQVKKAPKYGESWQQKLERLKSSSPDGMDPLWRLDGLIAKSNDDLRQEVFVMQLISFYQGAFRAAHVPVWLHAYRILSTGKSTGLIELIKDAISLDGLKKKSMWPGTLRQYFIQTYGDEDSLTFKWAQTNFMRSMAGYSVICYLLAIKDRHNGNIMLDAEGHLIHIDFGFVLGIAPGGSFSFETASFKLTLEMIELLGGANSPLFEEYVGLMTDALKVARVEADTVATLIDIMAYRSNYPCFHANGATAVAQFRDRLMLHIPDNQLLPAVRALVTRSMNHSGTWTYDRFQLMSNAIAM